VDFWLERGWSLPPLTTCLRQAYCAPFAFGLDRIIEHGTAELPDTTVEVNPAYRRLQADLRPDYQAQTLTVEIHRFASSMQDAAPDYRTVQEARKKWRRLPSLVCRQSGDALLLAGRPQIRLWRSEPPLLLNSAAAAIPRVHQSDQRRQP
jgi:hypothetical protein